MQAQTSRSNVLRVELFSQSRLYQVLQELEKSFGGDAFAAALYQKALFLEFLILLNRFSMDAYTGTYIENSRCNSKILPVLDYIGEHLAEDISIDLLASRFYMSRYYLMHLFKQETGYSVAVSYTHLDVYKRQAQDRILSLFYLTAPVIPSAKLFCRQKNTIAVGKVQISTPSISIP